LTPIACTVNRPNPGHEKMDSIVMRRRR
jgi:hypothetical protein